MDKTISPTITVLMPVYNAQLYITEAINSVLNQTFTNFEFLIINDGSSDDSETIIKSFTDPRIVYLENEKNQGLIFTLNRGVSLAKGDYIARMDQDDICDLNRFQEQLSEFSKNDDLVICGSFIKTFKNSIETYIDYMPSTHAQIISSIYFRCPFAHPSVMMKVTALKQLKEVYREDYLLSEDYDLWSRLIYIGKGINIPKYLLNYRIHDKQMSQVHQVQKYLTVQKIQNNLLAQLNIVPSEMESLFMLNLFKGISRQDKNYLYNSLHFLDVLHQQFSHKYPSYKDEHARMLVSRWFKICGNTGMGFLNIKLAFKLPFFKVKYLKFNDFIKLIYKTITNYKQLETTN